MKNISFVIAILIWNNAICQGSPNIVWIVVDDMYSRFGYQGEPLATPPRVDCLAKEGIVFSRAYATAPVCSTFRSAMITGMYQATIGAHHHRSSLGELKIELPRGVRTIPELFREAGYFTTITDASGKRNGKQDYDFVYEPSDLYDLTQDPWEINNLSEDPAYQDELSDFRALLGRWVMDTDDKGRYPESLELYDSDMAPHLKTLKRRKRESAAKVEANIELTKTWRMEGK